MNIMRHQFRPDRVIEKIYLRYVKHAQRPNLQNKKNLLSVVWDILVIDDGQFDILDKLIFLHIFYCNFLWTDDSIHIQATKQNLRKPILVLCRIVALGSEFELDVHVYILTYKLFTTWKKPKNR